MLRERNKKERYQDVDDEERRREGKEYELRCHSVLSSRAKRTDSRLSLDDVAHCCLPTMHIRCTETLCPNPKQGFHHIRQARFLFDMVLIQKRK